MSGCCRSRDGRPRLAPTRRTAALYPTTLCIQSLPFPRAECFHFAAGTSSRSPKPLVRTHSTRTHSPFFLLFCALVSRHITDAIISAQRSVRRLKAPLRQRQQFNKANNQTAWACCKSLCRNPLHQFSPNANITQLSLSTLYPLLQTPPFTADYLALPCLEFNTIPFTFKYDYSSNESESESNFLYDLRIK